MYQYYDAGTKMDKQEIIALGYLSENMRKAVTNISATYNKPINEIRLREGKKMYLTISRENVASDYVCTAEDILFTTQALCQGSLYSYSDSIKEGVITTKFGIRAGVCGRAVLCGGVIDCVRDISSVNIRIPHRVYGAADALYELVNECGSVLVYSKPGLGKTTLLRELIPLMSGTNAHNRVAVIDTRYELSALIDEAESADILLGYPRREGIMTAVRTMSPEYIICDEISTADDRDAIMYALSAGVNVVVSAHADSYRDLSLNKSIKELVESNAFSGFYGIRENSVDIIRSNE